MDIMADRLEEMDVRTLERQTGRVGCKRAGRHAEGLAEVEKNTLGNKFSRVEADALEEILSG